MIKTNDSMRFGRLQIPDSQDCHDDAENRYGSDQREPQLHSLSRFSYRTCLNKKTTGIGQDLLYIHPRIANGSPSHLSHKSKSSQEVIHTTLLDFDDLESISETMSLASSKNLNPTINPTEKPTNPTEKPTQSVVRASPTPPVQSSAAPVSLRPPKAPPVVEVKKEVNIQPVMDFLDAPLTMSPVTGDQGIDGLEDPFSFMPMAEPAAIMQSMEEAKSTPAENKEIQMAPQTQPVVPVIQEWSSETHQVGTEANKDASLNIQQLSGLDALFVQQMDDFMHFGYLSNVTRHSYI